MTDTSNADMVTEEEFRRLSEFLYRRSGLIFGDAKRYYVTRRLSDRMNATSAVTFENYYRILRSNSNNEIEKLINAFTVNETYFYREDYQFRCLTNDLLPNRLARRPPSKDIRIWSVPCSTGEEPYSLAIWLLENWPDVDAYDIEIVGSDIDTVALESARQGSFGKRALMRLPDDLIEKYFRKDEGEQWRILDDLRESVHFLPANLVSATDMANQGEFDVIFCRNVLIYFDDASRRVAAEALFECLMPGGFICLGHTESMSRISPLFEVCRYSDAIVYQRPWRRA